MWFWARVIKNHYYILNHHSQIGQVAKFGEKKLTEFVTQMPYLVAFAEEFQKTIVIFEPTPSNLSNCTISRKNVL